MAREVSKQSFNQSQAFAFSYLLNTWGPQQKQSEIAPISDLPRLRRSFATPKTKLGGIHMSRTTRPASAFARKSCVIATELALALMAAPLAYAQQAAERGERIEVTG